MPSTAYNDLDAMKDEVRDAPLAASRHNWQTINESYVANEEIAREVLPLRSLSEHSVG